ncbi:hypothetical protein [Oleiharenicola lentus]|uniref:hypothetical protein n=1 Tax=Oleiharenicola lentus TaxID=2508720 RepID=UPI003F6636C9
MNKTIEYTLFSQPVSRRTFYWIVFLCPWAALFIYLSSRRVTPPEISPRAVPASS